MKKKIKKGTMMIGELRIRYEKMRTFIEKTGSMFYTVIIFLMCCADISNFFTSFDAIYNENIIVLFVLSVVLALIIDQAPAAISEYLFRDDKLEISPVKKKLIRVFIVMSVASIVALIAMLFLLRFSIIPVVFMGEEIPEDAARSMTLLWSSLAVGTTIASFLYSGINKTVLQPALIRALQRKYIAHAMLMKDVLCQKIDDLEHILADAEDEMDIDIQHASNIDVIKADVELVYSLYQAQGGALQPDIQDHHPKVTVFKSANEEKHLDNEGTV